MSVSFDAIAATMVSRSAPLKSQSTTVVSRQASQSESFAAVLANAADSTVTNLQNAEALSIKGIKGEANTYEVASAVMQAEQSLRMAIGVRDKMVSAYMEISRMQI